MKFPLLHSIALAAILAVSPAPVFGEEPGELRLDVSPAVQMQLGPTAPASAFPALEPQSVPKTISSNSIKETFSAIPEPQVLLTVVSGLGMLAALQRFRRVRS